MESLCPSRSDRRPKEPSQPRSWHPERRAAAAARSRRSGEESKGPPSGIMACHLCELPCHSIQAPFSTRCARRASRDNSSTYRRCRGRARYGRLRAAERSVEALGATGSDRLYVHQAEQSTWRSTGSTSSSRRPRPRARRWRSTSRCSKGPRRATLARALYIYPTKALQLKTSSASGAARGRGWRDQPAGRHL